MTWKRSYELTPTQEAHVKKMLEESRLFYKQFAHIICENDSPEIREAIEEFEKELEE